jgi:hypothetical protein
VSFTTIDSAETAEEKAVSMKREETGVIRINRKFARGYDFKLARDARVVVVANGNSICFSEVL